MTAAAAPAVVSFFRPSRSGGFGHAISLLGRTLEPVDLAHPCSCPAGMSGRLCWAVLEVLADEAPKLSGDSSVLERAAMAREVIQARKDG